MTWFARRVPCVLKGVKRVPIQDINVAPKGILAPIVPGGARRLRLTLCDGAQRRMRNPAGNRPPTFARNLLRIDRPAFE